VDLIIMATEGRQRIVDALRGSVSDRVVGGATCPVLAVPAKRYSEFLLIRDSISD
jgi:nucleotide-binding universal stress UspA family protein